MDARSVHNWEIGEMLHGLVTSDPLAAGEGFGDWIDPVVSEANDGYSGWSYGGRAGIDPDELMGDIY